MSTKQTLLMSFCIAVFCAAIVWWLERFQEDKMKQLWGEFLDTLPIQKTGEET